MLESWHREEIFAALSVRGWEEPTSAQPSSYEVGERYVMRRDGREIELLFVADVGTGYAGPNTIEEAVTYSPDSDTSIRLWLARRPDSKWKRQLIEWADAVSGSPTNADTITVDRVHGGDGAANRELYLAFAPSPKAIRNVASLPTGRWILMVAADSVNWSPDWCVGTAAALLGAGAVYVAAWGPGASRLEGCFDEAFVMSEKQSGADHPVVLTTSHEDETLEDALWFATSVASPAPEYEQDLSGIILLVVESHEWLEKVRAYISAREPD